MNEARKRTITIALLLTSKVEADYPGYARQVVVGRGGSSYFESTEECLFAPIPVNHGTVVITAISVVDDQYGDTVEQQLPYAGGIVYSPRDVPAFEAGAINWTKVRPLTRALPIC